MRGDGQGRRSGGGRLADGALSLLLLAMVGMMIIPLPTALLDVLIASNIALSLLMLLIAMSIGDGLGFTAMPTVLLVTTLYRLALNVSSTRLILLQADAGEVIRSFGEFVVRGNYVVGAVIFLILTLIQYVVIARGSERVAEVGARFSLDAMPGKQMAIDADLRSGALTPDGARQRRRELDRENQFYGAMDGAMKFVKGDAIAAIAITVINLGAGIAIGVGMRDLGVLESVRIYGLLTIGDGLVSQIPALLCSTSAGLVVTRVAAQDETSSLGADIGAQLLSNPRVLALGAGFVAFLSLVPGLPTLPFAVLAAALGALAYVIARSTPAEAMRGRREIGPTLPRLSLELGAGAGRTLHGDGAVRDGLRLARERVEDALGLPLPELAWATSSGLDAEYRFLVDGAPVARGPLPPGGADAARELERALESVLRRFASELLGVQETQELLDQLAREAPALVESTVPSPISRIELCQILRGLLAESVSIRPLRLILELLSRNAGGKRDIGLLVERVRAELARQITFSVAGEGVLKVHPVDPLIEDVVRDAVQEGEQGRYLALPPDAARDIVAAVAALCAGSERIVLVAQPDVRRFVRRLIASELPDVAVLSYPELAGQAEVERGEPLRIGR